VDPRGREPRLSWTSWNSWLPSRRPAASSPCWASCKRLTFEKTKEQGVATFHCTFVTTCKPETEGMLNRIKRRKTLAFPWDEIIFLCEKIKWFSPPLWFWFEHWNSSYFWRLYCKEKNLTTFLLFFPKPLTTSNRLCTRRSFIFHCNQRKLFIYEIWIPTTPIFWSSKLTKL
jgi:hypothetical protein